MWKRIKAVFGRLWKAVSVVDDYLPEVLQVVEWVAEKTPTRADDEILTAARAIGVAEGAGIEDVLRAGDKGRALAMIVEAWARRRWPEAPTRRIRRAIELAYGMLRP